LIESRAFDCPILEDFPAVSSSISALIMNGS
jgi:hypothetical protein